MEIQNGAYMIASRFCKYHLAVVVGRIMRLTPGQHGPPHNRGCGASVQIGREVNLKVSSVRYGIPVVIVVSPASHTSNASNFSPPKHHSRDIWGSSASSEAFLHSVWVFCLLSFLPTSALVFGRRPDSVGFLSFSITFGGTDK